jgi:hypothetical protein
MTTVYICTHPCVNFLIHFLTGNPALLSQIPTQQLTQEHGEKMNRVWELCGNRCENQRAHMGLHILCKMRGVEENLKKPVSLIINW